MRKVQLIVSLVGVAVVASACTVVPAGYPGGPSVYAAPPGPVVMVPGLTVVYRPSPRRWSWW
jgi:hypothetical protein